ncbi:P-loop NTPase [Holophaga foetida]|uniref:P-loop NTPase n=1 Tax=Holophaga foetida TaxID=35839 RepID=UPI0002475035|nr:P-loop NTPase [Holophaga foetida]
MSTWNPIPTRTRPENFGPMKDASAHARFKGPCGDTMEFWLYLDGVHIREASFTTDGCDTSVACGSVAAHLCIDRSIGEMKAFKPEEVIEVLGWQEQEESHHCALLAVRTIGMAIKDYEARLKAEEEAQGCSQDSCSSECCESCSSPCDSPKDSVSLTTLAGAGKIKQRILVLSGKGGVGKSTVATNLAMAFASQGLTTGLLDVDIHGPSVPKLLGLDDEPLLTEGPNLIPVELGNLKVMSMGFALGADQPAIWRGPMKAGVVEQFVQRVHWGELDVLVVDCPPGTGDEHLSLKQALGAVDGAVIVTTPQEVAVLDARKAVSFCKAADIPVLGVIENMSGFACPHCSTVTPIFSSEGGRRMADDMGIPFLGSLPLDPKVGLDGDAGRPRLYAQEQYFGPVLQSLSAQLEGATA